MFQQVLANRTVIQRVSKWLGATVALLLAAPAWGQASAPMPERIPQQPRELAKYARMGVDRASNVISGMSRAQWVHKPAPWRWSPAECAEHIVISEQWLLEEFLSKFGKNAKPARIFSWAPVDQNATSPPNPRAYDRVILGAIHNRSHVDRSKPRGDPPLARFKPAGRYETPEAALAALRQFREKTIQAILNTAGLRDHWIHFPWADGYLIDGHQYLLRVVGHGDRHLEQIKEVIEWPR